jgi:hypothetical protein
MEKPIYSAFGNAAHYAQVSASDLMLAYGICLESGRVSDTALNSAITYLIKTADALGYDLVKRQDKEEAA